MLILKCKEMSAMKDFIKATIFTIFMGGVMVAAITTYNARIEKIERGEMVLVNQNEMDR